ncbi:MAG: prepilin-type N-terminal cleavage/methylation domain-containing protein, partial [Candidatus Zixiibacteriota bacterium]
MRAARAVDTRGFTLIELVMVIIVLAVLAAVGVSTFGNRLETAKVEQTKREMDQLAKAIVGDADVYGNGTRGDFGYVGDVGSLPPNLDALVTNPGGYATWQGPYVEAGLQAGDFKKDGWGVAYVYIDTLIRSTGSGTNIDKVFARSTAALVSNTVRGVVRDANLVPPGNVYRDSLQLLLTYPDGSGSTTTTATLPNASGGFQFNGVPIGNHQLRAIYLP